MTDQQRYDTVVALKAKGMGGDKIAVALMTTPGTIHGFCARRNIAPASAAVPTQEQIKREEAMAATIRRLFNEGHTRNAIARTMGIGERTVTRIVAKYGISRTMAHTTAQRAYINEAQSRFLGWHQGSRPLPPVTDEAEAQRLIREAIAAGKVTRCQPGFAAPVNNGTGL